MQLFRNPICEGLPTMRPEPSLGFTATAKVGSRARLAWGAKDGHTLSRGKPRMAWK